MAIADGASHAAALKSRYSFGGFLAPVNMPPVVSTPQACAAVPVKFSLGGNKGVDLRQGLPGFADGLVQARRQYRQDRVDRACRPQQPAL
jgi:hypothetical protein